MDGLIVMVIVFLVISAFSSSANKRKTQTKNTVYKDQSWPQKGQQKQGDWGKRAGEVLEKVMGEKGFDFKNFSPYLSPYTPSKPQIQQVQQVQQGERMEPDFPPIEKSREKVVPSVHQWEGKGMESRLHSQDRGLESRLLSMEERMKDMGNSQDSFKGPDSLKNKGKKPLPSTTEEQFFTFSDDPLVQGMIMSEVFTRPCERKRGLR